MQIIRDIDPLRQHIAALRSDQRSIALVPTMGALHAGHMALVEAAKRRADHVVVSIFVNPMQFGAGEDLDRYPRNEDADRAMLGAAGVGTLWVPTVATVYPPGFATKVSVARLGDDYCGAARPGHFDGVATVVAKLLGQVRPDVALFGEKDWQQLAIIRRMTIDLDLNVEIAGVPIVRDADGLAFSSRNAYLSPDQRIAAPALPKALNAAALAIIGGADVRETLASAATSLGAAGFARIDYVALVDGDTLAPITTPSQNARILVAAVMGTTRLIDNIAVAAKK